MTEQPQESVKTDNNNLETISEPGIWAKIFKSPFFWIVFAIIALITVINYLERFTNVEVHNQYQIF
ncbi:MAG: hypothetical protein ACI376_05745 [Candidatus Bruticola sp.]